MIKALAVGAALVALPVQYKDYTRPQYQPPPGYCQDCGPLMPVPAPPPPRRGYPGDMPVPYGGYDNRIYREYRSYRDFDGGYTQPRPDPRRPY